MTFREVLQVRVLVARGAVPWSPRQPEGHSSGSGQDRGRNEVGGPEVSIRDSELPWTGRILLEIHSRLLQDSRALEPVNKENCGLSLGA